MPPGHNPCPGGGARARFCEARALIEAVEEEDEKPAKDDGCCAHQSRSVWCCCSPSPSLSLDFELTGACMARFHIAKSQPEVEEKKKEEKEEKKEE
jgi:hypothetical protein